MPRALPPVPRDPLSRPRAGRPLFDGRLLGLDGVCFAFELGLLRLEVCLVGLQLVGFRLELLLLLLPLLLLLLELVLKHEEVVLLRLDLGVRGRRRVEWRGNQQRPLYPGRSR